MSKEKLFSRRRVVKLGIQVPAAGAAVVVLGACGEDEAEIVLCTNPNALSFSENSIRQANNFTELSTDPEKNCLNCAFFTPEPADAAGEVPDCGHCSIFEGFASKKGYCDSWSTKDTGQG